MCEIVLKSFNNIKHTKRSPIRLGLFYYDTIYSLSTYNHRPSVNSLPPSFSSSPGCSLVGFLLLSVADVVAAVWKLPDKQCDSDAMPTRLLKDCADVLTPFLVELFNRSLQNGSVPTVFKAAYVTPLLKKPNLDAANVRSYRPISNVSVLSKLLVTRRLVDYLSATDLLPELQKFYL